MIQVGFVIKVGLVIEMTVGRKLHLLVYFCFHIALLNLFGVSDPTDMMSGVNISIFHYI